ncbi:hemerythrin domain-containing protein [Cryptosporangium phraense]|nr:hemerythrin domain-containing protein [Cryptosporangium phraense]
MADSRDMVGAHDMFRLHFGALPGLVRGVAPGDTERAAIVSEHAQLLTVLIDGHHGAEDDHVWPKLHARCPDQVQTLVSTMEAQHTQIHGALEELAAGAQRWAASADQAERESLAAVAERLDAALIEHFALEEARVLTLIDAYLTDEEWKASVASSAVKLTPDQSVLAVGMLIDRADESMREILREGAPPEFWEEARPAALRAYRSYAERVYR